MGRGRGRGERARPVVLPAGHLRHPRRSRSDGCPTCSAAACSGRTACPSRRRARTRPRWPARRCGRTTATSSPAPRPGSPAAGTPTPTRCSPGRLPAARGSPASSCRPARPACRSASRKTRWGCGRCRRPAPTTTACGCPRTAGSGPRGRGCGSRSARWTRDGWASRPSRPGWPRPPWTTRPATPGSGGRSASGSSTTRAWRSCSRTWRPRSTRPGRPTWTRRAAGTPGARTACRPAWPSWSRPTRP